MSELSTVLGPSTAPSTCWNSLPPATGACQTLDLGPDGTRGWPQGLKRHRDQFTKLVAYSFLQTLGGGGLPLGPGPHPNPSLGGARHWHGDFQGK